MATLITGHKGFIGSRLYDALGGQGIDIKDGFDLLTCELPKDIDIIYHLAAQTSVEASWHDPVHDMDNLRITARLVQHYPRAKIIYANSAAAQLPVASPYGFSKRACRDYIKAFHKNWVICVFPNVFGGGKGVVDLFKDTKTVTIYGDGEQTRDFVHVSDIVQGLIQAKDWKTGEYFMGSGKATSVLELAGNRRVVHAPARIEARDSILPNTTPNWEPVINVHEYLS